jgi:SET and MYND domain-containing protein
VILYHLDDLKGKAEALFIATSMVNHSCRPNVVPIFKGRTVYLKCLSPIAAGDEIVMNYVDPCQPEKLRNRQLESGFGFICGCSLCLEERMDASKVVVELPNTSQEISYEGTCSSSFSNM